MHPLTEEMFAQAARWQLSDDRRAIFLDCYARMTAGMLAALDEGRFQDPAWIAALLRRFAEYYFVALATYEQQDHLLPAPWQIAFDTATQKRAMTLQDLLLGVNAHINYDLVLALNDMLRFEWSGLSPSARQLRYEDHGLVNQIIAETIDVVQEEVVARYTPAMRLLDASLGHLDEWFIARLISRWRDDVWRWALDMVQLDDAEELEAMRRQIEAAATRTARTLLAERRAGDLF